MGVRVSSCARRTVGEEFQGTIEYCAHVYTTLVSQANLSKQLQLEEWAQWLEAVVDQVLAPYHDKPIEQLAHAGKSFLLKWSFYR